MRTFAATLACCLLFITSAAQAKKTDKKSTSIEDAYKKEFAFLETQKKELQKRLDVIEKEKQQKIGAAQKELSSLQNQLLALTVQADNLTEMLYAVDEEVETVVEHTDLLDNTVSQASLILKKRGITIPEYDDDKEKRAHYGEQLALVFDESIGVLMKLGKVRKEEGSFFLADGTKVKGTIVKVGSIASYGISDRGSGVLAPAGEGGLKIWEKDSGATAKAVAAGSAPELLKMFIYESLDEDAEKKQKRTVVKFIQAGGVIAWVIVCMGSVALLMIILRAIFLWQSSRSMLSQLMKVGARVEKGDLDGAMKECKKNRGAISRVIASVLRNIDKEPEQLENNISESILHENAFLDRFGSIILVFAAVAPLLGLLGTVTGMISTFDVITEFGTGNPKMLSGGISEALITTELGLTVAIPTLLMGNLLSGWAEMIKRNMQKAALHILNLYQCSVGKGGEVCEKKENAPAEDMAQPQPEDATNTESNPTESVS